MKRNLKLYEEFINDKLNEISTLGKSGSRSYAKKHGLKLRTKKSGMTDYVYFTDKDGKEHGPFDASILTRSFLNKKLGINEEVNEEFIKDFKINEKESYEKGCAMLYFESNCTKEIHEMIKEEDLYIEEGDVSYGLEKEPHCTLLYGLNPKVKAKEVFEICENFTFETCEAHNISLFETDKYDVLKFDIKGKNIKECNEALSNLPYESDFPNYHPHMTIAYLKQGRGAQYVDMIKESKFMSGGSMTVNPQKIVYSHPNGDKEEIQILKETKNISENKNIRKISLTLDQGFLNTIKRTPTFLTIFSKQQLNDLKPGENIVHLNQTAFGKAKRMFGDKLKEL